MSSAIPETLAAFPVPNGMSTALGLPDAMQFRITVDAEITRLKGDGEPDAVWLDELQPLYAAGISPEEAARHIVGRRYPKAVERRSARRRRGLIKWLLDGWREWDFQRALRQTGRA
jgi:hypothetical protein